VQEEGEEEEVAVTGTSTQVELGEEVGREVAEGLVLMTATSEGVRGSSCRARVEVARDRSRARGAMLGEHLRGTGESLGGLRITGGSEDHWRI